MMLRSKNKPTVSIHSLRRINGVGSDLVLLTALLSRINLLFFLEIPNVTKVSPAALR